jgi:nitroreductase
MSFQELIRLRHSVRGYLPDPVPEDVLLRVLEAGRMAPTACNLQPFHLIVVTDPETRADLKTTYAPDWFHNAPVILVGCAEPAKAWTRGDGWNAAELDLAIAMDHLILAATEEGLGTCWVCAFDEAKAKEILRVPPAVRIVAMTPLGYASETPRATSRKRLEELVRRERW